MSERMSEKADMTVTVGLFIIATFMGALFGWLLSHNQFENRVKALESKMSSVAQIAIADFGKVAMTFPQDISDAKVDDIITSYNDSVKKLQEAGYVVINGQSVTRAPEEFYIPDPRSMNDDTTGIN